MSGGDPPIVQVEIPSSYLSPDDPNTRLEMGRVLGEGSFGKVRAAVDRVRSKSRARGK